VGEKGSQDKERAEEKFDKIYNETLEICSRISRMA